MLSLDDDIQAFSKRLHDLKAILRDPASFENQGDTRAILTGAGMIAEALVLLARTNRMVRRA